MLRAAWMIFARTALAARSLETIHFGPEYCGRALSPEEGGEWGDGNERTGDEASSRRERSETADGRRNPGHGKGSGSRREDSLQGRGGHNRDRIHLALEAVPDDHPVREIAAVLDLSRVYAKLAPYYPEIGRPSCMRPPYARVLHISMFHKSRGWPVP